MTAELLQANREWAARIKREQPNFFDNLLHQQSPQYLWIGCSDSRVPANQIVGLPPGEVFVHRNVANQVVHTDLNCLSVLQYAVEVLKVKHVIVCGHYGCGGVAAAFHKQRFGLIDNWLRHVQDVETKHAQYLGTSLANDAARVRRLCELNVVEQVRHVAQTTIIMDAWARQQPVSVHGWVYDLADGLIQDLRVSAHDHASTAAIEDQLQSVYGA
jgi:carbonic anhydrase